MYLFSVFLIIFLATLHPTVFVLGLSLNVRSNSNPPESESRIRDRDTQQSQHHHQSTNQFEDKNFWYNNARNSLSNKLNQARIQRKAKNVILFVGDGMSISTVTASRIFKGQQEGLQFGEEAQLHFDTFPVVGSSKTYCSNWQVADSACSSTAYLTGTKSIAKTIGMSPSVIFGNCTTQMDPENQVSSILAWAQATGMSTGIVTTTTATHSSPASAFAHAASSTWENNLKIENSGEDSEFCDDIAEQLVYNEPGKNINVILAGGREHFLNQSVPDVENPNLPGGGRTDGKNLIEDWLNMHQNNSKRASYIYSRAQLLDPAITDNEHLLGLFAPLNMAFNDEREQTDDPSLPEMVDVALEILSRNPNGFFLFVEGGRIDQAHHLNWAKRAMVETLQFETAIKLADDFTEDNETLIVVTSDHSHLFTLAGDPPRGNPILGLTGNLDNLDGEIPFTTLAYINGPGYREPEYDPVQNKCVRVNVSGDPFESFEYMQPSQVPRASATHSGEDVLIFAKGPWAHLLTGVNEQNFIPHAMAFAACVHPFGENSCDGYNDNDDGGHLEKSGGVGQPT